MIEPQYTPSFSTHTNPSPQITDTQRLDWLEKHWHPFQIDFERNPHQSLRDVLDYEMPSVKRPEPQTTPATVRRHKIVTACDMRTLSCGLDYYIANGAELVGSPFQIWTEWGGQRGCTGWGQSILYTPKEGE